MTRYLKSVRRSAVSGASEDWANRLRVNLGYGGAHKENPVGLGPVEIDPTDRESSEMSAAVAHTVQP